MTRQMVEVQAGRLDGAVTVPGSKSVTHRSFLLAAQSTQACIVSKPLLSADTRATLLCLRALGARVTAGAMTEAVQFLPSILAPTTKPLDCANSGTTLRLLAGTCARLLRPIEITGDASLRSRPNGALVEALRGLGAKVSCEDQATAPLTVQGPIRSGNVRLPPATSSQFASSLLLSLPFVTGDSRLTLEAPVASSPYLDVTLDVAARAGLDLQEAPQGPGDRSRTFLIPGDQHVKASRIVVDGDWSSAAFPLAAAAVTQGSVTVHGLDKASRQGDRAILGLLEAFGAKMSGSETGPCIVGGSLQSPGTVDVQATPDLFPILAVVAACARGKTVFTGGAALRHKETDRIAAMAEGLTQMGIAVQARPDGLTVTGGKLNGATVRSHGDHRIHMAFAVAGLVAVGVTRIDDPSCADVSYPGFHAALADCGAPFRLPADPKTPPSLTTVASKATEAA